MSNITFDHSKHNLEDAMNLSDDDLFDISNDIKLLAITDPFDTTSEMAQMIHLNYNYKQILFMATHYMDDSITYLQQNNYGLDT